MNPFEEAALCSSIKPSCSDDASIHIRVMDNILDTLNVVGLDVVLAIRLAFITAAIFILVLYNIPAFRTRLFAYGARLSDSGANKTTGSSSQEKEGHGLIASGMDYIASMRIHHSHFTLFYVVSVTLSALWMGVFVASNASQNSIVQSLEAHTYKRPSMTTFQVLLVCTLLLIQGWRRLLESYSNSVHKSSSKSQMWIGHFLIGIFFYIFTSIAIWIEGLPVISNIQIPTSLTDFSFTDISPTFIFSLSPAALLARLPTPPPSACMFLPIFIFATGAQYDTHEYLRSLPKPDKSSGAGYTRPTHPHFSQTVTPHYFHEVLIYLSLTFLAAPEGRWVNKTVGCGLIFVAVNLGVTANETREFWRRRWGEESVKGKARMIPYVY